MTVSTENDAGSHLSARRVVYTFPDIHNAQWVLVDQKNPFWFDHPDAVRHSQAVGALVLNQNYQSVYRARRRVCVQTGRQRRGAGRRGDGAVRDAERHGESQGVRRRPRRSPPAQATHGLTQHERG